LTPVFTHDIAVQQKNAINSGTSVILDSPVRPLVKIGLAEKISEHLEAQALVEPDGGRVVAVHVEDHGAESALGQVVQAQVQQHVAEPEALRARRDWDCAEPL